MELQKLINKEKTTLETAFGKPVQAFCPHLKGYKFISKTTPIMVFFTTSVRVDNADLLEFKYVDCIKDATKALPKEWKQYKQDLVYP